MSAEIETQAVPAEKRISALVVTVFTPDREDGGTDSDVFLEIGGQRFELDNDANNFERGKTDTFRLDANFTLREIRHARILLDCPGGGWWCGWIAIDLVLEGDAVAKKYKRFDVNGWLDSDEGSASRLLQEDAVNA